MKNTLIFFIIISSTMNCFSQDSLPYFKKNEKGKYALFNINGKASTKHKYSYVSDFNNGIAHVAEIRIEEDDYSYLLNQGIINIKGEEIIKPIYDEVQLWNEQKLIRLKKNELWEVYNFKGVKITSSKYSQLGRLDHKNGLIKVEIKRNGNYYHGYINLKGETIIPCEYLDLTDFSKGLAYGYKQVLTNNKETNEVGQYSTHGVLDSTGNIVIPMIYDEVLAFSNGLFRVKKSKKYGYVDYNGKVIIPLEYFYVQHRASSNGLFLVKKNWDEDEYFINLNNEKVFTPVGYDNVHPFLEGRAIVKKNGKYGFLDENGELVIPLIYDDAIGFENKLARAELNTKIGFINSEGKVIIPIIYDKADTYYFSEKYVKMTLKNTPYFFDVNGNKVTEEVYNSIQN